MSARRGIALRGLATLAITLGLCRAILGVYFTVEVPPLQAGTDHGAPLAARVLLIVIDGLRYDTALESGWMPRVIALGRKGAAGVALAPEVTMTSTGVRVLGSGVSPSMADLVRYGALPPVAFDNLPAQVSSHGGRVVWVGDTAWRESFGPWITGDGRGAAMVTISHLMDNVDGADKIWVQEAAERVRQRDWQLAIVMLGGVDHASHRWTPSGDLFRRKIERTDADIGRIVDAAGEDTTVIVTSDHGAGIRGHHGSGEPEARRTPLVMSGPGIAPGVRLAARQIDVAPTLAALLGVPLPSASEGRVLVETLAAPAEVARAIAARNLRQLERCRAAYAEASGRPVPEVRLDDPYALADWLERDRARASLGPFLWALSLILIAVGIGRWSLPPWTPPWAGALVAGLVGALSDGRSGAPAIAALAAVAVGGAADLRSAPEARGRPSRGLLALAAVELLVAWWRMRLRMVELWELSVAASLRTSTERVVAALTAAVALPVAAWLRARTPGPPSEAQSLVLLAALAAAGAELALPVGIAAGAVAVFAIAPRRELPSLLAALAAAVAGVALADGTRLQHSVVAYAGALLVGTVAVVAQRPRWALPTALLAMVGVLGAVVRWLGSPPLASHALLLLGVGVLLIAVRRDRLELAGFVGAQLLAQLSRPGQVPGLLAWIVLAVTVGRLLAADASKLDRRLVVLVAALACISVRLGLFALFEGAFRFSQIEVDVGYTGNPGTEHLTGGVLVCLKLTLAYVMALALVTARMRARERGRVLALCVSFTLLRIGHVVLSMTLTRGTFYSPFEDTGHLLFLIAMLGSLGIVAGLLTLPPLLEEPAPPCRQPM